jgi:hypothetical protein
MLQVLYGIPRALNGRRLPTGRHLHTLHLLEAAVAGGQLTAWSKNLVP